MVRDHKEEVVIGVLVLTRPRAVSTAALRVPLAVRQHMAGGFVAHDNDGSNGGGNSGGNSGGNGGGSGGWWYALALTQGIIQYPNCTVDYVLGVAGQRARH